ncbi:hypothetical protein CEJ45_24345 [Herbaspirillum aquaticum]|uniref:Uncharacterized protein n=1 Tax=Herbaspirillum aquaticum TaxID=568783 RepID=A0A225SLG7_9BURK|nr:hypothetical protein CEJ45_24345 [Herbaspirillum aquaticum]
MHDLRSRISVQLRNHHTKSAVQLMGINLHTLKHPQYGTPGSISSFCLFPKIRTTNRQGCFGGIVKVDPEFETLI